MKKLFSILLVLVILTGCTAKPEVVSETTSSETTTTSIEKATTTSEVTTTTEVTENTTISTEETQEFAITHSAVSKDFFDDDVVFEEIYLPVKRTRYNGHEITQYEYDAAGNLIREYNPERNSDITWAYEYNTNGTYNAVLKYSNNELIRTTYDKRGYCTGYQGHKNEYKFDEQGILSENHSATVTEEILQNIHTIKAADFLKSVIMTYIMTAKI